jgi:hypothetical protein
MLTTLYLRRESPQVLREMAETEKNEPGSDDPRSTAPTVKPLDLFDVFGVVNVSGDAL